LLKARVPSSNAASYAQVTSRRVAKGGTKHNIKKKLHKKHTLGNLGKQRVPLAMEGERRGGLCIEC